MTQLNTPYPATAYLTGFLRQHEVRLGLEVAQADAAIELFLRLFSKAGLQRILGELRSRVTVERDDDSDADGAPATDGEADDDGDAEADDGAQDADADGNENADD